MKEIAFTVNPDSELYANHFIQKAEKKRFAELASAFLNAHFPGEGNNSIMPVSYTHLTLPTTPYV